MKKRIFGTVLTVVLAAVQAVTGMAAGSRTAQVTLPGEYANYYEVREGTKETFAYLEADHPQVLEIILAVNAGEKDLTHILELAPELEEGLKNRILATPFFELKPINGGIVTEDGKYRVKFEVPSLTENMTEVQLLHYSTVRSLWEIVEPEQVEYENKMIEAKFEDLSPVAVIARSEIDEKVMSTEAGDDSKTNVRTKPEETAAESGGSIIWGIAAAIMVLAAVLFVLVSRKTKKK